MSVSNIDRQFVEVPLGETLHAAYRALQARSGDLSWLLVAAGEAGRYRVGRFTELLPELRAEPRKLFAPLEIFAALQPAEARPAAGLPRGFRPAGRVVLLEAGRVTGVIDPLGAARAAVTAADRALFEARPPSASAKPPMSAEGGGGAGFSLAMAGEAPAEAMIAADGDVNIGGDVVAGDKVTNIYYAAAKTFQAYPALDAPASVAPQARFTVTAGFRAEPDPDQPAAAPIKLEDVPPEARFTVMLITDGARVVDGEPARPLAVDAGAAVAFECEALPGVSQARVSAHFVYNAQVVGLATRRILVGADAPLAQTRASAPSRLNLGAAAAAGVDLQVTLTRSRSRPGFLQWTILAPNPPLRLGPILTELEDARGFAAGLIGDLRTQGFAGRFAFQILANRGQDIADSMPVQFFEALRAVFTALGRPPTLLFATDETYVPWELAVLEEPLDPDAPPFLMAQTRMGRWLLHEKVGFPPPTEITVTRLTALALSAEAAEPARLQAAYAAQRLDATQANLQALVFGEHQPGHLVHFAGPGPRPAEADDQALVLADGRRVIPAALAGRYRPGETPAFTFVFLNACQVGTAGSSLGQAAGFPGDLIRGGAQGFLAPLWEVEADGAAQFALDFYNRTLQAGETTAAALWGQRQACPPEGPTTPLAYIFYGHPNLRLRPAGG